MRENVDNNRAISIIHYSEGGQKAREIRPRATIMSVDPTLPRAEDELPFLALRMAPHVPEGQIRDIPP